MFHLNKLSGYLGFSCGSRKEKQITWIRCFSHLISIHFSSCSLLILEIFLYHTLQFWNMPKCFYLNSSDKNNQLKQRKVYNWSIALNIQLSVTVRAHAMHTVHSNTCTLHALWKKQWVHFRIYLTIIPRARVGYEIINSQRGE